MDPQHFLQFTILIKIMKFLQSQSTIKLTLSQLSLILLIVIMFYPKPKSNIFSEKFTIPFLNVLNIHMTLVTSNLTTQYMAIQPTMANPYGLVWFSTQISDPVVKILCIQFYHPTNLHLLPTLKI